MRSVLLEGIFLHAKWDVRSSSYLPTGEGGRFFLGQSLSKTSQLLPPPPPPQVSNFDFLYLPPPEKLSHAKSVNA